MKALTLTQPYATLVAIGAKRIETRSWSTSYRGPLAIHAAKGLGPVGGRKGLIRLLCGRHFQEVLGPMYGRGVMNIDAMPRGAIVATCELVDCVSTTSAITRMAEHLSAVFVEGVKRRRASQPRTLRNARLNTSDGISVVMARSATDAKDFTIDLVSNPAEHPGPTLPWFQARHGEDIWQLPPPEPELSFGDYTPGRYAWLLANVQALPEPIPAKGAMGLWEWETPA